MNHQPETHSPLLQAPRVNLPTRRVRLLLLAIVAAGVGGLLWFAQSVPAVASELSGWFGRPHQAVDTPEGRRSQVIFLLLVYSAPLALGAIVYAVDYLLVSVQRRRG